MQNEFDETSQEDLRRGALEVLNPGAVPPATDEKQDRADGLRLKHILALPSDKVSADDNAFLRAQILAGLRAGLE
jgi:hypothetical protein